MRKFLIFVGLITCYLLSSCDEPRYKEVNGRTIQVVEPSVFYKLKYVEFDDHEYVYYKNGHSGSISHSPKCPCLNEYKK